MHSSWSSWTSVSVGLSFSNPRTNLARTSAPIGVLTETCLMCCAFPSLFVLQGFAFFRSFRCILSISVPCHVVLSVLHSMLSFLGVLASLWSKPLSTPQLLGVLLVLL